MNSAAQSPRSPRVGTKEVFWRQGGWRFSRNRLLNKRVASPAKFDRSATLQSPRRSHAAVAARCGRRSSTHHVNVFVGLKLVVLMTLGSFPEILRIATRVPLYQGLVLIGSV